MLSSSDKKPDIKPETNGTKGDMTLPDLPDFFHNKTFFLYGKFEAAERRTLFRFITAYDG